MKKLIQAGLFFAVSLIAQESGAALPQTLQIATEATYPPFEFVDSKGQIQGFDIDIVNALCKQIKVTCTFSNQPWDSLIPSLKLGKFDVLVGGMNITEARKQQVDFTDPYYTNSDSFVGVKAKPLDITSIGLKDKTIGVQGGTTAQYFLEGEYPQAKIKTYASEQDAFLDLVSGRVDAVLADTPVVMAWLKDNNASHKYAVLGNAVNDPKYFGPGYGIAFKKGNTELLAAFNKALAEIKTNRDYKKIVRRYF